MYSLENLNRSDEMTDIVITRPAYKSDEYAEALIKCGFSVRNIPFIEIRENQSAVNLFRELVNKRSTFDCGKMDWIIFTSKNAVDIALRSIDSKLIFNNFKIISIGPATSETIKNQGGEVFYECQGRSANSLIQELSELENISNSRILLPTSLYSKSDIQEALQVRNAEVIRFNLYEPKARKVNQEEIDQVINARLVCFFSPSAVRSVHGQLVSKFEDELLKKPALALGPVTAAELINYGFKAVYKSPRVNLNYVVKLVTTLLTDYKI